MHCDARLASRALETMRAGGKRAKGYAWLAALALQFGLQPMLTSNFLGEDVDKGGVVLVTEAMKAMICLMMLGSSGRMLEALPPTGRPRLLLAVAAPAGAYAVQNVCLQVAYQKLDSVTFNCLNQLKIASAALFVYLFFGKRPSRAQALSLILVMLAGYLLHLPSFQANHDEGHDHLFHPGRRLQGLAAALSASGLSGLAAALAQVATQKIGFSAPALTFQMACFASPMLIASSGASTGGVGAASFWRGWKLVNFVPILGQALGGIIVGQVTSQLGAVSKAFGLVCGLVVTGFAESVRQGEPLPLRLYVCLFLVIVSTYLHEANPAPKRSP